MRFFFGQFLQKLASADHVGIQITVAFLLLVIPATTVLGAEPHQLRVLCYNIHYGQGTDGRYDIERLANVKFPVSISETKRPSAVSDGLTSI